MCTKANESFALSYSPVLLFPLCQFLWWLYSLSFSHWRGAEKTERCFQEDLWPVLLYESAMLLQGSVGGHGSTQYLWGKTSQNRKVFFTCCRGCEYFLFQAVKYDLFVCWACGMCLYVFQHVITSGSSYQLKDFLAQKCTLTISVHQTSDHECLTGCSSVFICVMHQFDSDNGWKDQLTWRRAAD